jgi:hypothetical protein
LVGIAGDAGNESSSPTLHLQSTHLHSVASGLQQQPFAVVGSSKAVGFAEQQTCSCSGTGLAQHEDAGSAATTVAAAGDSVTPHVQPESEIALKTNGCKPMAAVANTRSAVSIVRRIVDLFFMRLLSPQMIVVRSVQVKTDSSIHTVYVNIKDLIADQNQFLSRPYRISTSLYHSTECRLAR